MRWPNVAKLATTYLTASTGVRTVTRLPEGLEGLTIHRVARGPGSDDKITDSPLLDVETFAPDEDAMWEAAEAARQAIHALAGAVVNGDLVDNVTTTNSPVYVDYQNPKVWRAVASYRIDMRKRRTP